MLFCTCDFSTMKAILQSNLAKVLTQDISVADKNFSLWTSDLFVQYISHCIVYLISHLNICGILTVDFLSVCVKCLN